MLKKLGLGIIFILVLSMAVDAFPNYLDQQGILRNVTNGNLINRTETFNITIFNLSNDVQLYTEEKALQVLNGVWNYQIGYTTPLIPSVFYGSTYFKTKVSTDLLTQVNFTAVPYSFYSMMCNDSIFLDGLPASSYSGGNTSFNQSYTDALYATHIGLTNNVSALHTSITNNITDSDARTDVKITNNVTKIDGWIVANYTSANALTDTKITNNVSALHTSITNNITASDARTDTKITNNVSALHTSITNNITDSDARTDVKITNNVSSFASHVGLDNNISALIPIYLNYTQGISISNITNLVGNQTCVAGFITQNISIANGGVTAQCIEDSTGAGSSGKSGRGPWLVNNTLEIFWNETYANFVLYNKTQIDARITNNISSFASHVGLTANITLENETMKAYVDANIVEDTTIADTNASTECAGTTTYLDGEGNCDDISAVYATHTSVTNNITASDARTDVKITNNISSFASHVGLTNNITNVNAGIDGNVSLLASHVGLTNNASLKLNLTGGILTGDLIGQWINASFNWTTTDEWSSFNGYVFDFNESQLSTVYYNAIQNLTVAGTVVGTLADTQHLDGHYDGLTFNLTETAGAPGLDIRMNFTGVDSFNAGLMRYKTTALSGEFPIIQLWNYDSSDWEDYPQIGETLTFSTISQSVYDNTDHISSGIVQMRIYKASNGNVNNKYYMDWVAVSKGYGTPAGEEIDPFSVHRDGTIPLTGNWDAGSYYITALGFNGTWNGSYYTMLQIDTRITNNVSSFASHVGVTNNITDSDARTDVKITNNVSNIIAGINGNVSLLASHVGLTNNISSFASHTGLTTNITNVNAGIDGNVSALHTSITNNITDSDARTDVKITNNITNVNAGIDGNISLTLKNNTNANFQTLNSTKHCFNPTCTHYMNATCHVWPSGGLECSN